MHQKKAGLVLIYMKHVYILRKSEIACNLITVYQRIVGISMDKNYVPFLVLVMRGILCLIYADLNS